MPRESGIVGMKRDPALVSLSRDHHRALSVAQRLRRATSETAAEGRANALEFWEDAGRTHFRLEEEVLLPAYAREGDAYHPLVARVLCDHVAIRSSMNRLAGAAVADVAALHELGAMLAGHVRLEERELFALIEHTLSAAQLEAVAAALDHACAAVKDDG
jgi:hemerythrin-like domain-containing protein